MAPLLARCVQSCSSVWITGLCVSPSISEAAPSFITTWAQTSTTAGGSQGGQGWPPSSQPGLSSPRPGGASFGVSATAALSLGSRQGGVGRSHPQSHWGSPSLPPPEGGLWGLPAPLETQSGPTRGLVHHPQPWTSWSTVVDWLSPPGGGVAGVASPSRDPAFDPLGVCCCSPALPLVVASLLRGFAPHWGLRD